MSQLPPDSTCSKCGASATLMCQRCMEFYCGSDCQILDWKEHKSKCYQMPQLIPIKRMLRGSGGANLNDSMRRPHTGGSGHNDSMRRGGSSSSSYSMARNPLPTDTDEHCAKPALREDKDFVLRPKLVAPSPAIVEQEIALKKLSIANGSVVYITRVLTHAEVFIAAASCKDYASLFETFASKCMPYSSDDRPPAKGDVVLVNGDGANFFRGEILNLTTPNAFHVLNIDTGVPCAMVIPLRLMRKLNNAVRAVPVQLQRVRLIYVESIPHAVPGNKALAALERCRMSAVDFAVKFDEMRSEVVDLLFLNKESSPSAEQSLSKKLLPLLFEKCDSASSPLMSAVVDEHAARVKQQAAPLKKSAVEEIQRTLLPPSPPKTPDVVTSPISTELVGDATVAASTKAQPPPPKAQHFDIPNLGAIKISADTGAAAGPLVAPKMYTLDDLKIVPITVGDNVPLFVLDAASIFQGYITASDFGNKSFLSKMESYLATVSKYCKSRSLENAKGAGGYTPRPNEICLAVYADDGEWYRALCIDQPKKPEHGKDEVFRVMFLDYGNVCKVSKRETLPITEELMFPSNANMCYVEGLDTKEQRMAFFKAVCANPIISCNVTRRSAEEDTYTLQVMNLGKLIAG